MTTIQQVNFPKILLNSSQKYFKDFYNGKIKRPCDEDCQDGCTGKHNYELPVKFNNLFELVNND